MEKEFVPFELAVKLKELGFNEPCIAYYTERGIVYDVYTVSNFSGRNVLGGKAVSAPLWGQAFDWFRGKYSLYSWFPYSEYQSTFYSYAIRRQGGESYSKKNFLAYEEARQACLEKLIELCQQN